MQDGTYGKLAKSLSSSDPRMKTSALNFTPPPKGAWTPWSQARDLVVVLRLGSSGSFEEPVEYTSASVLATVLREKPCLVQVPRAARPSYKTSRLPQSLRYIGETYRGDEASRPAFQRWYKQAQVHFLEQRG